MEATISSQRPSILEGLELCLTNAFGKTNVEILPSISSKAQFVRIDGDNITEKTLLLALNNLKNSNPQPHRMQQDLEDSLFITL